MFIYTEHDTESHRNTRNIYIWAKTNHQHENTFQLSKLSNNSEIHMFQQKPSGESKYLGRVTRGFCFLIRCQWSVFRISILKSRPRGASFESRFSENRCQQTVFRVSNFDRRAPERKVSRVSILKSCFRGKELGSRISISKSCFTGKTNISILKSCFRGAALEAGGRRPPAGL